MSITYNTTRTLGQIEKKKSWKSGQVTRKKKKHKLLVPLTKQKPLFIPYLPFLARCFFL